MSFLRVPLVSIALFATTTAVHAAEAQPSADLRAAIAIGDTFLPTLDVVASRYTLVAATNGLNGPKWVGPSFWRLTYKSCGDQGVDVEPVCKGGELFIGVDLAAKKASFIGAGE